MAEALGHKWGQVIGDIIEAALRPILQEVADKHGLYLDVKGSRPARSGKKLTWKDKYGNSHDLDYVIERDGSDVALGKPVAFIESAWRRYTKHSKNKAQEIEGALIPLRDTYASYSPFLGAIVAGQFTGNAIVQLRSRGFVVLSIPYDTILEAFAHVGIDASFGEATSDQAFAEKLRAWEKLSQKKRDALFAWLLEAIAPQTTQFVDELERRLTRAVAKVRVWTLHGKRTDALTIGDAIDLVLKYDETKGTSARVVRYELAIAFTNGDVIEGKFGAKPEAVEFLKAFL